MNKNMKKIILVTFVIMLVSFGISGALFIQSGDNIINIERKDIDLTKNVKLDDIKKIHIDMTITDVQLISEDRKDVKIHFYGEITRKTPQLNVEKKNKELLIHREDEKAFSIEIKNFFKKPSVLKLDVYIPKDYAKNMEIETVSGDIDLSDVQIENGKFSTVSGEIEGNTIIVKKGSLDTTSGNVHIDRFEGSLDWNTTSGNIDIDNFIGKLDVDTTSGDLSVKVKKLDDNISVSSISGDVQIKLPESAQFRLESKTVSGSIQCAFPLTIEGEINKDYVVGNTVEANEIQSIIKIETISGDIELSKE
ncbi:DUF4097 family beta strand repeat-containing protein [Marinisporobacter balticus]|uniref:DUF4097 and DUF4098 domain-containing protein YvlB n=1 Tax=Marinisporobacter balticus TaxID=2018667 RepID=A0A4R2KJJ1_9FIRM|nr:DUF4097 family beta strand repeat-containing protein [Marinisporobacter balticus]TCO70178.1 DUF4097 and DUF4098 domain-containing protein YvlB [Marinisporobacter balticus]